MVSKLFSFFSLNFLGNQTTLLSDSGLIFLSQILFFFFLRLFCSLLFSNWNFSLSSSSSATQHKIFFFCFIHTLITNFICLITWQSICCGFWIGQHTWLVAFSKLRFFSVACLFCFTQMLSQREMNSELWCWIVEWGISARFQVPVCSCCFLKSRIRGNRIFGIIIIVIIIIIIIIIIKSCFRKLEDLLVQQHF